MRVTPYIVPYFIDCILNWERNHNEKWMSSCAVNYYEKLMISCAVKIVIPYLSQEQESIGQPY